MIMAVNKPHVRLVSLGIGLVTKSFRETGLLSRRRAEVVDPLPNQFTCSVNNPHSYGYRPGRSPLNAVAACRERCFRRDWVVDLDVKAFFDSVAWDLMLKAVERHTDQKWILLYVERWLKTPMLMPDGTLTGKHSAHSRVVLGGGTGCGSGYGENACAGGRQGRPSMRSCRTSMALRPCLRAVSM